MLFGDGVHRQRMLPLGVEKWQGVFKLFGPLQGKLAGTARAPEANAQLEANAAAPSEHTRHSAPTASHTFERERRAASIVVRATSIGWILSHPIETWSIA
jgi:hypothetical protein